MHGVTIDCGLSLRRAVAGIFLVFAVLPTAPRGYAQSEWTNLFPLLSGVTYGNGLFVAVGDVIETSSDGRVWTARRWGHLNSVTFGKQQFVAVGVNGAVLRSSDGLTWTDVPTGFNPLLTKVIFAKDTFIAV